MPSPVVAFTLTRATGRSSARARRSRISCRWGPSFGSLHDHGAVDVLDFEARRDHGREDCLQQLERVGVAVARVGVGKVLADVPQPGGPEQRVDHRVSEHVGIGVPLQTALVRDLHAAEDQSPPAAKRWQS